SAAFAAGGILMVLGLIQYRAFQHHLGAAGSHISSATGQIDPTAQRRSWYAVAGLVAAIAIVYLLALTGVLEIDPLALARGTGGVLIGIAVVYFAYMFALAGLNATEKKR